MTTDTVKTLRRLDPATDRMAVEAVFRECDDYLILQNGRPASCDDVDEFFTDLPPGVNAENKYSFGVFDAQDNLVGLCDLVQGYPRADDWYLGWLLIGIQQRNSGLGTRALEAITGFVEENQGKRILLCVIDKNPCGRVFWEREGFVFHRDGGPGGYGQKIHNRTEMVRVLAH